MEIKKKTGTANTTASRGRRIEYIAIHYTAGASSKPGSAANVAAWFANPSAKASADYIVDDGGAVQYNPDPASRYCWAVGGNRYKGGGGSLYGRAKNANTVSIEICSSNRTGRATAANDGNWYFTDSALANAAELARELMAKYSVPAERVIRHYDVNGKPCPGVRGWNAGTGDESAWAAFKARLGSGAAPKPAGGERKVRVKVADLNIRREPSMSGKVVGQTGKGTFTVTEERDGWGRLKSGAGWIYIENPKYVDLL